MLGGSEGTLIKAYLVVVFFSNSCKSCI